MGFHAIFYVTDINLIRVFKDLSIKNKQSPNYVLSYSYVSFLLTKNILKKLIEPLIKWTAVTCNFPGNSSHRPILPMIDTQMKEFGSVREFLRLPSSNIFRAQQATPLETIS